MNKSSKTKQQLLLEIEELTTRLDVAQQRLQHANELMQSEMTERKRVEEDFVRAQKHAENIVETIREPLLVLTADLKVISANQSFYQTFKVTREETVGRFIYSVGNRVWDIPALRKLLEEIVPQNSQFTGFEVDHEFPVIGRKMMLLNARRIYQQGKGTEMILLAIEDITERNRARKVLEVSETRYRRLFETAQDGILTLDASTGEISDVNPFLIKMLGYSHEELLGRKLWEIGAFRDIEASQKAFSELQARGYVRYEDLPLQTRDGRHIDVEFVSNVYLVDHHKVIQCNIRDITDRKRAEEALQRAHDELEERVKERTAGLIRANEQVIASERAMEERLRFERLLSGLSARFVIIPPDRVDSEIEDGLRKILEFFQVDHCALIRTSPGKTSYQITHVASSDNAPPVPVGAELPRSIYPWAYEKLVEKHEMVSISRLDDLPAEANVDRQTCIEWGIRSYVNIPLLSGESVGHIINVSSVKSARVWPEELFPRLRLLGEVFVNALQRKQAEEASRESERILRENENDLRRLAGRLIYAHEEERSRLARELHDDLAQRLAVFAIDVGKLEQQLMDSPTPVREKLREMQNGIVRISQDVHSLSRQLHPSILDDLGLIKAAESECTSFSRREGIEVVFNHENISRVIPKDVSLSLYRIIQEGLRNISKHACAEHISVSLIGLDHDVLLSVQDDGIGFDWAEVKENPGLGFSSMRERARLIHGEISIQSQPKKGTVITLRVPLTREGE